MRDADLTTDEFPTEVRRYIDELMNDEPWGCENGRCYVSEKQPNGTRRSYEITELVESVVRDWRNGTL